jgi:hypothetical protein
MRRHLSLIALLLLACLALAPTARASTGTLVRANCAPVAAGGGVMAFNTRQANGLWDVRVGGADCQGAAPLPAYDGHRGASDMTTDGRYVLLTTAYGPARTAAYAEPGKGVGNDLELLDRQTGTVRRLTTGRPGIIWAKLKPDATKVVWSELVAGGGWFPWDNDYLGSWAIHVANLDVATGVLSGERTWTPSSRSFVETYGWVPGTNRIIFDSDYGIGQQEGGGWTGHWFAAQLQTIPEDLAAAPARLTGPIGGANIYHEFAHFNGDGWLYTSVAMDAKGGGMDLWRYRPDGTGRERVSWFGGRPGAFDWSCLCTSFVQVAGFPPPRYGVVGGMAWIGGAWVAGVAGDTQAKTIDAYRIVP